MLKTKWSKFMEQVTIYYLTGEDENGVSIGGFIEIGRDNNGIPSSIAVLPNKACTGWLALWAAKIHEIKNNLLTWLRGIIRIQ